MTAETDDDHTTQLAAVAADLARRRYAPLAAAWDADRQAFPLEERRYLGAQGLLGICLPEHLGGAGAPLIDALIVIEELAKECRPAAFQVFEANTGPARVLSLIASEELQQRFLPRVISGDISIGLAISEPDAGSAATDLTTRAKYADGNYTVNGGKRWTTNGSEADAYLVYARLNDEPGAKGIGALIVEADRPGVSFGARERLMGFRGIPSADVRFDDVVVPAENLVVGAGGGFATLFKAFSLERLGNSTMSLAIGQAALDRTVSYVQERTQFGKQLIEFQSVQMTLADMVMQVEAARLLTYKAAALVDAGKPFGLQAAMAKCYATDLAMQTTTDAVQIFGGRGYLRSNVAERFLRELRVDRIWEGTSEVQRLVIARALERRGVESTIH